MVKLAFDPAELLNVSDPKEMPAYTTPEAAWALRIPESTVRSWFFGQGGQFQPLLTPAAPESRLLSFNNLVEVFVLRSLRQPPYAIPMPRLRKALDRVENELGRVRPLLHESFKTDGVRLFIEVVGQTQDAESGQRALFEDHLTRIDFKDGQASRVFPFYDHTQNRQSPRAITIDVERCFGRPIVDRISVPTEIIHDRWWAGERIEELATDYRCKIADIDEALRYERTKKAA